MRLDELLDNFFFYYKDFRNNSETTFDETKFGVITMMKAIINLRIQRTILSCLEGILNSDEFLDNLSMDLRSLSKEGRDCILIMELKKILWECLIPS